MAQSKIFVAGHRGMVGSAIVRALQARGESDLLTRTHGELDLTNQAAVDAFFAQEKPDQVYLAAAHVGGILANNTYPATFIYDNLMIAANVIHAAHRHGVQKLLFLGSSCIYPRLAAQPMAESALLTGPLEPTNEPYAVAKIAGIKLCESYNRQYGRDYRSVMPTNLYGPGDNYHLQNSHVLPAMLRKFHLAKLARAGAVDEILHDQQRHGELPADIRQMLGFAGAGPLTVDSPLSFPGQVVLWGTGSPCREFLHVDDMASASLFVMDLAPEVYRAHTSPMQGHINVGYGSDLSIRQAAALVAEVVGYHGELVFDADKPDGAPRKLMDSQRIFDMGWQPAIQFADGLAQTYADYLRY